MPEIGEKIGSCEIRQAIGSGGHGSVWAAYCSARKTNLAVKILHANLLHQSIHERGPTIAERFLAEAELLQKLHHPGLCRIYDVFDQREQNIVAYSMELLTGADLTTATAKLQLNELINIFAKTADTLQYLHEHGVIHRDVKPANIFINAPHGPEASTRQIKLLDFGVAKELHQEAILSETATGIFVGSVQTMAPETFRGWEDRGDARVNPEVDQWALAVSLYQCLSGKLPFAGQSMVDLILALENDDPAPLRLRSSFQSQKMEDMLQTVLKKGLEKDPGQRFKNMDAFAAALREITKSSGDDVGTVVTGIDFLESTYMSHPPKNDTENSADALNANVGLASMPRGPEAPSDPPPAQKTVRQVTPVEAEDKPPAPVTQQNRILRSTVRMGALEFYFWLLTIFVLGFVAGFMVREL
jgi:serine/threonine protein kinase